MTALSHELELALRAETPRPSAEFAASLDRKVAAGFPRPPRARRLSLPSSPLPAIATGVGLLVAVVIAVSVTGGGSNQSSSGGSAVSSSSAEKAAPAAAAPKAATPLSRALVPPGSPRPGGRHVERSASLTLGAPSSKLDDVANGVVSVTDRHHGFVLHSSVTTGGGGASGGSFALRVPSKELQGTLSDLSGLADVRSRTQATDDITAPYNSVAGQLDEARALRHSLLERLARATTDTEAQALRRRIHLESAQIRALTARFNSLQNRARLATIDVSLVRERAHHNAAPGGVSGAFHDGLHSLVVSFGIALRVLGVALPLALLAALGWLGAALLKRRRREAALF
jgi:hypothetical protein